MANPLTEYLLVLATDLKQLAEYNEADETTREALGTAAGLTSDQPEVLASADHKRIMDAVLKELGEAKSGEHHRHPAWTIQIHLDLHRCKKKPG